MKVTISAAMRARDASRPHAEHLARAEEAEASVAKARPTAVADAAGEAHAADVAGRGPGPGLAGRGDDGSLNPRGAAETAGADGEVRREFRGGGRPGARRRGRARGEGRRE